MKYLFYLFFIFLISCHGNNDNKTNAPIPSKEQKLLGDMRLFPDSTIIVENLAQFYRENNQYDKAVSLISHSLQKDSLNGRLWDIKATLMFELDDTIAAIKCFEKSIAITPKTDVIISLGVLYAETKNPLALAISDNLILAPKDDIKKEGYFIKGLYHSFVGKKKEAIPFFDQCLSINYSFMEAYREKAIALYDMSKYNDAIVVLDKAITLNNHFDEGYYYMGRNWEKLNKPKEAMEMYQQALLYDTGYLEAKEALVRLEKKN
jgi:tetratricopeptide (TPR) repeat protein